MPRYYVDPSQPAMELPNGSRRRLTPFPFASLARVENCPCGSPDSPIRRNVQVTGEPNTYFSVPGYVSWKGRKVRGFVTVHSGYDGRPEGYYFVAMKDNRPEEWPEKG